MFTLNIALNQTYLSTQKKKNMHEYYEEKENKVIIFAASGNFTKWGFFQVRL